MLGMHKWERKELGAKMNADAGAVSCAGWWTEETEKHTHRVKEKSGLYQITHPGDSYLSKKLPTKRLYFLTSGRCTENVRKLVGKKRGHF